MKQDVSDPNFFAKLPEVRSLAEVVRLRAHHDVPDDYFIVISDVRGSTNAIESGRYRDVNALGVASILALRNALSEYELAFVFGGDGATILVPGSEIERVDKALRGVRELARAAFEMELRVARVSVGEIRRAGAPVRIARYRQSEHIALAAFSGRGFTLAEEWIKSEHHGAKYAVSEEGPTEADLSGFECRWNPIRAKRGKFVCLLAVAVSPSPEEREATYVAVLEKLDSLGCPSAKPPFGTKQMTLRGMFGDFSTEAKILSGEKSGEKTREREKTARSKSLIGKALLLLGKEAGGFDGKTYKNQFLENTDHSKFDEALRMVLDLDDAASRELRAFLDKLHAEGKVAFGTHEADSAMVTCIVSGYDGNHVHFLDGCDGGYALASKPLKAQLRALTGRSLIPARAND